MDDPSSSDEEDEHDMEMESTRESSQSESGLTEMDRYRID